MNANNGSPQPTHHGYAVNVKDYGSAYPRDTEPLSDEDVQSLYGMHQETFWRDAEEVAQSHGFTGIYGEGRSSGWMVPQPQPSEESTIHYCERCDGEGEVINDPDGATCPDCKGEGIVELDGLETWMTTKFRPFEADVLAMIDDARAYFIDDLQSEIDAAKAEPAEAAYWAARDVETVDA